MLSLLTLLLLLSLLLSPSHLIVDLIAASVRVWWCFFVIEGGWLIKWLVADTDVDAGGDTSWRGSGVGSGSVHHPTHCCICLTISDIGNCNGSGIGWVYTCHCAKKSVKNWGIVKLSINIKIAIKQKQFDYRSIILYNHSYLALQNICSRNIPLTPYPTPTNTDHDSSLYSFRKYHHPIDDSSPQQHPPNVNSIFDDGEDDALEVDGEGRRRGVVDKRRWLWRRSVRVRMLLGLCLCIIWGCYCFGWRWPLVVWLFVKRINMAWAVSVSERWTLMLVKLWGYYISRLFVSSL